MIKSVLGLGKTTPKSLETTGPLELPTGAEVIAVLETLAKGEKISAQDIQKAIMKKFKKKYVGKKGTSKNIPLWCDDRRSSSQRGRSFNPWPFIEAA
jgi:hypothetical protein